MTNWTDHTWVIRQAKGEGGEVIKKIDATNEFCFVANPSESKVEFYTVTHKEEAMTPFWERTRFVPRGDAASEVWPFNKLQKDHTNWGDKDRDNLLKFAAGLTLKSRRLEGVFKVGNKDEPIRLWIAEEAMVGNKPLLLIDLEAPPADIQLDQSGSGTGDPR